MRLISDIFPKISTNLRAYSFLGRISPKRMKALSRALHRGARSTQRQSDLDDISPEMAHCTMTYVNVALM